MYRELSDVLLIWVFWTVIVKGCFIVQGFIAFMV